MPAKTTPRRPAPTSTNLLDVIDLALTRLSECDSPRVRMGEGHARAVARPARLRLRRREVKTALCHETQMPRPPARAFAEISVWHEKGKLMLGIRPHPVNAPAQPQPPPVKPPPDAWTCPDARGRHVQQVLYTLAGVLFARGRRRREASSGG